MKTLLQSVNPLRSMLLIAILFAASQSNAQIKPSSSGYAPVNGIKVYYEVYGEGRPLVLLHGAFYTIEMNWGQLIPELSKTRKVIAVELQGHGHTPFSVEGVMNFLKVDSADVAGYSMGGSIAYQLVVKSPKRVRKLVIISSTYKTSGWLPVVNNAFKGFKPEFFTDTPMKAAYDAVAPDKTKWTKYLEQMIAFAGVPFDVGEANIAKITSPVLLLSGDNDGLDKVELMKTYQLLGGGVTADLGPMPKSHLAIVPGQGHVSLMQETKTILDFLNEFLQ